MIDPKMNPLSKAAHSEQSLVDAAVAFADSEVQTRAYQLYELRGRKDGSAEQDWHEAEKNIRANRKQA